MRSLAAALLLAGCSSGPSVIDVELFIASGQRPLADADQVTFSLEDSSGRTLAVKRSSPTALGLALDPVPAGKGYLATLDGTFAGDEVARAASCPFDIADGAAAPSVALYLGQVGLFAATGAPASIRQGAVAFPYGGDALIVGGDAGAGALTSTEQYAQSLGVFSSGPTLNAARSGAAWAPLADGSTLVIGGTQGFPSVEALADGKWTAVPTLVPLGLMGTAAAPLGDGSALACGGEVAGAAPLDGGWLFGTASGGGSPASPMVTARAFHTLTAASDDRGAVLLIIGGRGVAGPVGAVEIFDPVTNSFAAFGVDLATPRYAHSATRLQSGRILIAGGSDSSGQPLSAAEVLDPVGRRFVPALPLGAARSGHTATALASGRVLVAGGTDASGAPSASVEIFDPTLGLNGGFVPTQPLITPRSGHTATLLCDGTVLFVGGGAGAERYVPLP